MSIRFFQCENIGVSGTTPVAVQMRDDGLFEARVGIALLGYTNMTKEALELCNNPFDPNFHDNYAVGIGRTEGQAIEKLKQDMKETADSLWA